MNGDTVASLTTPVSLATAATQASDAGTYAITPSGAVDANYSISYGAGTLTITPAPLTVAADNKSNGIPLTVEVRLGRTGNELRLILAAPSSDGPTRDPDLPMLKAIARARDWYEKLIAGEIDSLSTIAKRTGLGARYVSRIFQCAFLAPDIIEAILDGRQPPELTLERLRHPLPIAWDEQRRVLGFPKT